MLVGNTIGGKPMMPKTCVFRNDNGQEFYATLVDSKYIMTAGVNDIREGKTAITDAGMTTGEKIIPAYHTYQGAKVINNGSSLMLPNIDSKIDSYDYTKMQAIVCAFNTSMSNSVSAQRVSIEDALYNVASTNSVSAIVKNHDDKTIEFGITNDTGSPLIIRYFMYKEIE